MENDQAAVRFEEELSAERSLAAVTQTAAQGNGSLVRRRTTISQLADRQGASLQFERLCYNVGGRTILDHADGLVGKGEVLAIMGPSGCGKTTLLNILAGRIKPSEGKVLLDGQQMCKRLRRQICYVLQNDLMFPHLTLHETLKFAALLRLPSSMSFQLKMALVEEVVGVLSIRHCLNTIVGSAVVRGLSGGERKRASIGVELLANPRVLLMDEPTSGLDSHIAHSLILTIKDLAAQHGRTIITSIHQPSSQTFYLFDKLLLLANGRVMYYGEAKGVVEHFSRLDFHCPQHYNPADFFMDVVSGEAGQAVLFNRKQEHISLRSPNCDTVDMESGRQEPAVAIVKAAGKGHRVWQSRPSMISLLSQHKASKKSSPTDTTVDDEERWPTSFFVQFATLSLRTFRNSRGDILSAVNLAQVLAITLASSLIWYQIPHNEKRIRDTTGYFFFLSVFFCFQPLLLAVSTFILERHITDRERSSGYYRLSAYYLGKTISELPLTFAYPTIFIVITYPVSGLRGFPQFCATWAILMLASLTAQSFGHLISSCFDDVKKATITAATFMIFFLLTGGFYVTNFPSWFEWSEYISFVTYIYSLYLLVHFNGVDPYQCDSSSKTSSYKQCLLDPFNATISGEEIEKELNLDRFSTGLCVGVLITLCIFFRALTYLSLRHFRKPASQ